MDDVVKQVLGPVSAYALAKQQGYSGTLEEWAQDQANAGANAAAAKKSAEDAAAILEQIKENNKSYDEEINKLKELKPEDIGAQPAGDYALKNEIPAPYTLPTATADTLGGVKSSEAVTVNADGTMTVKQLNGKGAEYYATAGSVNQLSEQMMNEYMSKAAFANKFPRFRNFDIRTDDTVTPIDVVLHDKWDEIEDWTQFFAFIENASGAYTNAIGFKISGGYGAYISISYNQNPMYYRIFAGTWSEAALA